ncbi:M15 family metallopeptidase [Leptotrichia hofstadii]
MKINCKSHLGSSKSKNINVEWGGNWKMKDTPHFELK